MSGSRTRSFKALMKRSLYFVAGFITIGVLKIVRLTSRTQMADIAAFVMRRVGPWLREHRIGHDNLAAAFPEKSAAEIETILLGAWDNLGRVAAEFSFIDRIKTYDPALPGPFDIDYSQETFDRFHRMRLDGKPGMLFTAHLANWELCAMVAAAYKLDLHVLYRRPSILAVNNALQKIRAANMGTLVPNGLDAPVRLLHALEADGHVGMLADQHSIRGVDVMFFGRPCKANPLIAKLARHVECPIHGARLVRLSSHRFRIDLTEAINAPRDAEGKIDVQATTQVITNVIETWVREHPEQWLWMHRRWR